MVLIFLVIVESAVDLWRDHQSFAKVALYTLCNIGLPCKNDAWKQIQVGMVLVLKIVCFVNLASEKKSLTSICMNQKGQLVIKSLMWSLHLRFLALFELLQRKWNFSSRYRKISDLI